MKAVFLEGASCEETDYDREKIRRFESGWEKKGCHSAETYFQSREALFESLKEHGFDTEESAYSFDVRIPINIGRNGELISNNNARHRLSMAKILGLEAIPVEVIVRHSQWQAIRADVQAATGPDELSERAQTYLDHPEIRPLVDW